jgi:thiopurine S-methyltransferase
VGVELSPIAAKAFFAENELNPRKSKRGEFTVFESGRLKIMCGDFFRLVPSDLGGVDIVYDRAALTALPEALRERYVAHLRHIIPLECSIFLVTVEDVMPVVNGVVLPATDEVIDREINALYERYFVIEIAHVEIAWMPDLTQPENAAIAEAHKVYRLMPRVTAS